MKKQIEKMNIVGRVYLWKYTEKTTKFPDWHFTVDKVASASLLELLKMMEECEWSSKKEIILFQPTENQIGVPNYENGYAKWKGMDTMILNFKKDVEKDYLKIIQRDNEVEIQFGENKFEELKKAIDGIPKGRGDFGIYNPLDEDILSIWWNLDS
jgi:hypothetical protein